MKKLNEAHNEYSTLSTNKIVFPVHIGKQLPIIKYGISTRAYNLMNLIKRDGPQCMSAISKYTGLDKSNTTKYVDKLIKLGYFTRNHSTEDKRKVLIGLTEHSENILNENSKLVNENIDSQIEKHMTSEELYKLIESYDYICSILKRFD